MLNEGEYHETPHSNEVIWELNVIGDTRNHLYDLQKEIITNAKIKANFNEINFNIDTTSIPKDWENIINSLRKSYDNDDSLEWALLRNPQIQNFLWKIVAWRKDAWNKLQWQLDWRIKSQDTQNNEDGYIESWEEFELRESTPQKFEEWLLSGSWISTLKTLVEDYLDENWNFIKGYSITEKDLKLGLEKARYNSLHTNYNLEHQLFDNNETKYLKDMWALIQGSVNSAVKEYMISGWISFEWMINRLEWLMGNEQIELIKKIGENKNLKDVFKSILKDNIRKYTNYVVEGNNLNLNTWTTKQNLILRSYLFIYWRTFFSDDFSINSTSASCENELTEVMEAIMVYDWELNQVKYNKYLEKERKAEQERIERERVMRQAAAKRNRERNNIYHTHGWNWRKNPNPNNPRDNDKWATIVKNSGIDLSDFRVDNWNIEAYTESWYAKQRAFGIAWRNFKESNKEIKDIITADNLRKLYNTSTNSIDEQARKNFLETDIMRWRDQGEINNIYKILKSFPKEYADALETVASWVQKKGEKLNERTRNHALGAIIDNVRYIFDDIVEKWKWDSKFEWFRFDESEPVKREWNDIIISGTFNGTAIKIRYDLNSWGLFMNSFVQHPSISKISIWNSNKADLKIWQLESFDTILDEYYRAPDISLNHGTQSQNRWAIANPSNPVSQNQPTNEWLGITPDSWGDTEGTDTKWNIFPAHNHEHPAPVAAIETNSSVNGVPPSTFKPSITKIDRHNNPEIESIKWKYKEMLEANLDIISDNIVDNTKKQSARNSIITKFLKTFNIISDIQEDKSIDFNDWSNLFDLLQIIENSDTVALEQFQIFMEKIAIYSWLKRWNNNILGSQHNEKTSITFNENNENKYISMIRDNANNFTKNPWIFKWKLNFDADSQLWFAQIIIENITNDAGKPNWKLDMLKMDDFIKNLDNDDKED